MPKHYLVALYAWVMMLVLCYPAFAQTTLPSWPYKIYRSNLHVHSDISNDTTSVFNRSMASLLPKPDMDHRLADSPNETISDALSSGLNCLGFADHGTKISGPEWSSLGTVSQQRTSGSFVALRGFEWTKGGMSDPSIAHINIFGSKEYTDTSYLLSGEKIDVAPTLEDLYNWVMEQAKVNESIVCQFNHPTYGNFHFNNFALPQNMPELIDYFALIEIGSGVTGVYKGPSETDAYYRQALRNGWRVAPAIGIDNFGSLKEQGARKRHTAILLSPSSGGTIAEGEILEALKARRTYASEDKDFILEYWAKGTHDKVFMGGMLPASVGDKVTLHLFAQSTIPGMVFNSKNAIGTIRLVTVRSHKADDSEVHYGNSNGAIKEFSFTGKHEITIRPDDICYYIKIVQPDGRWTVSAPIWIAKSKSAAANSKGIPTTTIFVMDCSSSMNENTSDGRMKLDAAKEAARHYLDVIDFDASDLGADHNVGVISFSNEIHEALSPTSKLQDANQTIDSISSKFNTNFGAPLDRAISWFEQLPDERRKGRKFIIFLSDGMTNAGPVSRDEFLVNSPDEFSNALRLYQRTKGEGIRIYTVGFGTPSKTGGGLLSFFSQQNIDEEVLHKIAEVPGTGGKYLPATDAFELDEVYARSFHDATGNVVFESTGTIAQGEKKQEGPINLTAQKIAAARGPQQKRSINIPFLITPAYADEPLKSQMLVTLGWSVGKLGIELKDPSGRIVDASYPGAHIRRDKQPVCIAIDSPATGNWMATISGENVPGAESRYHLIVSARVPAAAANIGGAGFGGGGGGQLGSQALLLIVVIGMGVILAALCAVVIVRRRSVEPSATPSTLAWLQVHEPGIQPRNVPVYSACARIGRDPNIEIALTDPRVSTHHAEVRIDANGAMVTDLGSTNGTWVNKQQIQSQALKSGDRIKVGDTVVIYFPA